MICTKNVTCDDMSQIGISIRTVIIDCVTKRLIKDNKDLIVVNIGCGFRYKVSKI